MALSFIFGGDTNETPETLQQKRALANALIRAQGAPRNVGEGLNALGDGIVSAVLNNRADAAQKAGTDSANSAFSSIASALAGGSSSLPAPGAQSQIGATNPAPTSTGTIDTSGLDGNQIYSGFMDTVKNGYDANGQKVAGVNNPYALAAIASTGKAESGFSPRNAAGTWNDGANNAGGIMSWNGPRLAALQKFAGGGNGTPQQQGQFFLQENPELIGALNNAKSVDEAQQLMNNAWAFKGYNVPGNANAANRLATARAFLPQFQGSGQTAAAPGQVASLDPSIGVPGAEQEMSATSPAPQPAPYRDPIVSTPNAIKRPASGQQQVAQALVVPQQSGPDMPTLLSVAQNPWLTETQKAIVSALINQNMSRQNAAYEMQLKQQDPAYQLGIRKDQAELDNMQTPEQQEAAWRARQDYAQKLQDADPLRQAQIAEAQAKADQLLHGAGEVKVVGNQLVRIGRDGAITDVTPKGNASGNGGFRFTGNAVDAQALNGLIDSGQITAKQAQQIAAGKTITGPNGEMLFLTPQSIFAQGGTPQGQPPAQQQGIDIFTGQPAQQPVMQPQGQAPQVAPVQQQVAPQSMPQQQGGGPIPLTPPKAATEAEKSAAGYADRMTDAQGQLGQFENQGLNGWDQFLTQNRFVPGVVGNSIVGATNPDYQQFDQARRNFINAQLRRESGAVISPEEFDNANKQYFPQPGDSPQVIEQKRQNRERALSSMVRDAGPTYKAPQSATVKADALAQARDAIAKGAPRDAVIQRLRENGIDPTGL
ncbi:hypothetical protein [Rhizobium leucaenae]|uniref:hypothetical protein n=1 Tax=Rhizobium leucaenae TaxID=29450 RepID=UPI00161D09C4|nr:hypothetical protein [Rhizobium leucaenae]MBB6304049.1 hypothetical protein [Rhizobium leucaenae]